MEEEPKRDGLVLFYRGFILMAREGEEGMYHCFIGMSGEHPLAQTPTPIIWGNDRVRIKRTVWSGMRGPIPDGSWGLADDEGTIRWFGFDEGPSWNESIVRGADIAMTKMMLAADALFEMTERAGGDGFTNDFDDHPLIQIAENISHSLHLRMERIEDLKRRSMISSVKKRRLMRMFEWDDE